LYVTTHKQYESSIPGAEEQAVLLQGEFSRKCAAAGLKGDWLSLDWSVTGVTAADVVNLHAYYADLIIIGQSDSGSNGHAVPSDLPERVVLGSGRPVLIVPYSLSSTETGSRILIAWKAGRESTRAVHDALPLLEKADSIKVLEINPPGLKKDSAQKVCAHLVFHAISATAEQISTNEVSIADALLNRVSVEGSDLLVMGGYAHPGFGTLTLGEVARHILQHMTVPVLMSH